MKILGIYIIPSMSQEKQFESMKEKLTEAVAKHNDTPLTINNLCIHYNMYIIRKSTLDMELCILMKSKRKY